MLRTSAPLIGALGRMKDSVAYKAHWLDLKRRERWVIFAFLSYLPIAGGVSVLVSQFTTNDWAMLIFPLLWMIFFVFCWLRFILFRCPNCGKHFNMKWYGTLTRGRRCVHCHMSRYEQKKGEANANAA